jgi:TolB-like protein/Flp pilus assembly protein TadD
MGNSQQWTEVASGSFRSGLASRSQNGVSPETRFSSNAVKFGSFEVNLESHELRKHGMRVRLAEKPFQILQFLLERAGSVVTRKALKERLWPDTHVGFEHSLNTAVNTLRDLLGDSAQNPRFIETLPRVGYRFIAPLARTTPSQNPLTKRMLAVLPFESLNGIPEQEYFADGLTEEMISQFGQLDPKRLGVIARTSAMQYKGTKKSIAEIARELKVDCVIEGSVRREESRARITVQLIEAADETHLWSASYDRELCDVLNVQSDVARAVGKALAFELLPSPQGKNGYSVNADAHESYLRGRFFWGQRSEQSLQKALASFEHALSIEPRCARSLSGIADCLVMLCWFGALPPRDAGPRAADAAVRAVEIDESLCEPHASLGLVRFWNDWDWPAAEAEFLRAIELNPSYAPAHLWYAALLNALGRFEEALASTERARELDPLSLIISMSAADPFFYSGQFDIAIARLRGILEQEPRFFPAQFNIGRAYVQTGMYSEAIAAFEQAMQFSGNREVLPALAQAHALAGDTEKARAILFELKQEKSAPFAASTMSARIHMGLGEIDEAFRALEKGMEERSFWNVYLKVDPVYDGIRSDNRFQQLLLRAGLRE